MALALDVPVIAAIDGVCIGGAFEFACSCDLRVASTRSRFACPEVGIGLVISNASTVLLPRLCGAGYTSELMLTGRLIGAQEAFDNGILNAVVEPDRLEGAARSLAEEIAGRAPLAVAATKRLLVDVLGPAVEKAMARETEALIALADTADMREGFAAFREGEGSRMGLFRKKPKRRHVDRGAQPDDQRDRMRPPRGDPGPQKEHGIEPGTPR